MIRIEKKGRSRIDKYKFKQRHTAKLNSRSNHIFQKASANVCKELSHAYTYLSKMLREY